MLFVSIRKVFLFSLIFIIPITSMAQNDFFNPILYSQNNQQQFRWALSTISLLPWNGKEKVLDIGSGDGKFTAYFATKITPDGEVVGVDLSRDMVNYAKDKYNSINNLSFIEGNVVNSVLDQKFDRIISFSALHWVTDQVVALKYIENSLRKGGEALLSMSAKPWPMTSAVNKTMRMTKWQSYFNDYENIWCEYDPETYKNFIQQTNLKIIDIYRQERETVFLSRDEFIGWNKAWMPQIKILPEKLREDFATDVVDNYLSVHPDQYDKQIIMKGAALIVVLKK